MKDAVVEIKGENKTVKVYDSIAEATKTLGEPNLLNLINNGVINKERGKYHRESQQETAAERRKLHKAMVDFAVKNGFKAGAVK